MSVNESADSRSRHLVDPELLPQLEAFPTALVGDDNLEAWRNRRFDLPQFEDCGIEVEALKVAGPTGAPEIGLRLYRPRDASASLGCIFHIHGGGYLRGAAADVEFLHRPLAAALDCAIVSVDYRLAPETPFPGAIEDCYAGLAWTFAQAGRLGIDARRIGVMGESAGGGLAAALALMARDRGEYPLAFQHLIYPMLDDRTCTNAPHPFAGEFVWPPANNHYGWSALLGHAPGLEGVSPYAAPARAADLAGLPPAFISTGALDLFVEEDMDYARRLIAAGVPTELHVWAGGFHGFDLARGPAVSEAARRASREALARALAR